MNGIIDFSKFSDITFDVQYINDKIKNGEERDGAGHAKEVEVILFTQQRNFLIWRQKMYYEN